MQIPFFKFEQPIRIRSSKYYQLYQCEYDSHYFQPSLFNQLSIIYPQNIQNSVHSRQAEYLAGRYVAHFALNLLGFPTTDISSGVDRAPVWPSQTIGSITHTKNTAICAVANQTECQCLGVDLAPWIENEVAEEISHLIIDVEEKKLLSKLFRDENHALTMAFSAKESLFKALYPIVNQYFDFSAAKLECVSLEKGTFRVRLTESLTTEVSRGAIFEGVFNMNDNEVMTIVSKTS